MSQPERRGPAVGRSVDAPAGRRPGVPMEAPPQPVAGAPRPLAAQPGAWERAAFRATPVFGTTLPPRGVSGLVRRAAYRAPEHRVRHWMMLLLADRIDAVGARAVEQARRNPLTVATAVLVGIGVGVAAMRLGR